MTDQKIEEYLSKEFIVKNPNSKTKLTYINNKIIIGNFLKADQKIVEQSGKIKIWTFKPDNKEPIEFSAEEVKDLQTI